MRTCLGKHPAKAVGLGQNCFGKESISVVPIQAKFPVEERELFSELVGAERTSLGRLLILLNPALAFPQNMWGKSIPEPSIPLPNLD